MSILLSSVNLEKKVKEKVKGVKIKEKKVKDKDKDKDKDNPGVGIDPGSIVIRDVSIIEMPSAQPTISPSDYPSKTPTDEPIPVGTCVDLPEGWYDQDGPPYNCFGMDKVQDACLSDTFTTIRFQTLTLLKMPIKHAACVEEAL